MNQPWIPNESELEDFAQSMKEAMIKERKQIPGGVFIQPKPNPEFVRKLYRLPVGESGETFTIEITNALFRDFKDESGDITRMVDLTDTEGRLYSMVWKV